MKTIITTIMLLCCFTVQAEGEVFDALKTTSVTATCGVRFNDASGTPYQTPIVSIIELRKDAEAWTEIQNGTCSAIIQMDGLVNGQYAARFHQENGVNPITAESYVVVPFMVVRNFPMLPPLNESVTPQ